MVQTTWFPGSLLQSLHVCTDAAVHILSRQLWGGVMAEKDGCLWPLALPPGYTWGWCYHWVQRTWMHFCIQVTLFLLTKSLSNKADSCCRSSPKQRFVPIRLKSYLIKFILELLLRHLHSHCVLCKPNNVTVLVQCPADRSSLKIKWWVCMLKSIICITQFRRN